jgi:hypothetical protein
MPEMKLIMESWDKFLDEVELGDVAATTPTDADETPPPTEQQIGAVEDLLKTIVALSSAVEDADTEAQETAQEIGDQLGEGSARRAGKMGRKDRERNTKKINQIAKELEIGGFSGDQEELYTAAKEELKNMQDAAQLNFVNTLANGNLLDIPVIKRTIDSGGAPLKAAITAVLGIAGATACVDELTFMCLAQSLAQVPQGA